MRDVLRYWLGMVRHQEALLQHIKAEPPKRDAAAPSIDLSQPGRGRNYFKLLCKQDGAEAFLLRGQPWLRLSMTDELLQFFWRWLRQAYFDQRFGRKHAEEKGSTIVAGFPVLFSAQRGELATLFRLPLAEIEWLDVQGQPWRMPRWNKPPKDQKPPASVRLHSEETTDETQHYVIDENVLSETLGVQEEAVGALLARLERLNKKPPAATLRGVLEVLSPNEHATLETPEQTPEALFARAVELIARAVAVPRVTVWPLGIVYDASSWATHHLQQDLASLIQVPQAISKDSACHSYLTCAARHTGKRAHIGRWGGRVLTRDQREVAEQFLGSQLTVAQGPPGTGKTVLIQSLCAGAVVERMLCDTPGNRPMMMVTSTNNRAVDNAIYPLGAGLPEHRLPIALRVCSRAVIATATLATLQRTAKWLERARISERAYERARSRLLEIVKPVGDIKRVVQANDEALEQIAACQRSLADLEQQLESSRRAPAGQIVQRKALSQARRALKTARRRVVRQRISRDLGELGEMGKLRRAVQLLADHMADKLIPKLQAIHVELELPEVPRGDTDEARLLEAFDELAEVIEQAEDDIDQASQKVPAASTKQLCQRVAAEQKKLAELRDKQQDPAPLWAKLREAVDQYEPEINEAAMEAREAWATMHGSRLLISLIKTMEELEARPSLRALQRSHQTLFDDLMALFPVLGCTLLSMGNVLPLEQGQIERAVIDEAGQCHPAYAVSAIYRAERALVIGDVHQLEPVIELSEREEARVLRRLSLTSQRERLEPFRVHGDARASAQALASHRVAEVPTLRDHFRCQPQIIGISNELCGYQLCVRTQPASLGDGCSLLAGPLLGIQTQGKQAPYLGSWRNEVEIHTIVGVVRELSQCGVGLDQIAVLTPYRGQHRALETALHAAGIALEHDDLSQARLDAAQLQFEIPDVAGSTTPRLALGTLHRFQGGERDVVILSMVISQAQSLPFTNGRVNLINVAVSRARQHLIVVGNRDLLARGPITSVLVRAIPKERWMITGDPGPHA